ncbi:uncharacterized protein [Hetaerina americana]|uniref:uncharacterized protein n=1 Tax=Hetaerina americana TaxID=62018 RepID=UPI003A7F18B6
MSGDNGVEEAKSQRMRLIYPCFISNQLDVLINKISDSQFSEIYACLSKNKKSWKGGPKVFKIFKDVVRKNTIIQLDDINKTVKLDEKLASMDDLRSQYSSNKDTIQWRPDGNVEKTLISHDMAEKLKRKAHLQSVVDRKMKEIETLKSELNNICSQLKSEDELDDEIKKVNEDASIEMKNFHYLLQARDSKI